MSASRTLRIPVPAASSVRCASCAESLVEAVRDLPGVTSAGLDQRGTSIAVTYDADATAEGPLRGQIEELGVRIPAERGHVVFKLTGLDCPDCARTVDKSVSYVDGVMCADLVFSSGVMVVEYVPGRDPTDEVVGMVRRMGYGIELLERTGEPAEERAERGPARPAAFGRHEVSVAAGVVLFALGWALASAGAPAAVSIAAYAAAIVVAGSRIARRAVASIRARLLDMNVLMTLAVIGAAAIGEWNEGAAVVVLYSIGNLLEARSLARTRASIRALMELTPPRARIRRDGEEIEVTPSTVAVGETLIVRPGERVALDGEVIGGSSAVDEAPITGESVPVDKEPGDAVFAGTLNTSGVLEVNVTAPAADSTISRVVYMVEEAQARKAPSQRLVDRFTRYYTPAVVGLAAAIAVGPPLAGLAAGFEAPFAEWFGRALVILVVSCPCALVISTPVAVVSAITRATRDGVLVKGGLFLEAAPRVRAVALDKTGTLTSGRPTVSDVVPLNGGSPADVLRTAAALEEHSTHPLAEAVVRAAREGAAGAAEHAHPHAHDALPHDGPPRDAPLGFADVPGRGVSALLGGVRHTLGTRMLAEETAPLPPHAAGELARLEEEGKTVLVLAADGRVEGLVALADEVRPEAPAVVAELLDAGVEHVVMLTGDNDRTAAAVARHAGVHEYRARLLPQDKVAAVRELKERYGTVAMVGDGVNDAPALAVADIGIAMGAKGSDTALETADVAMMREGLAALPRFLILGRRTTANIVQNVAFSVVVKVVVLVLALLGIATLWMAVFADTGVSLLVTLNGLRLLRTRAHAS